MAVGQYWGLVVEVVVVGGTCRSCSPCAVLLCCALCVCGVRTAVGRGCMAVCRGLVVACLPPPGQAEGHGGQSASTVHPRAVRSQVAVDGADDCAEFCHDAGMELRQSGGLVVLAFTAHVVEV